MDDLRGLGSRSLRWIGGNVEERGGGEWDRMEGSRKSFLGRGGEKGGRESSCLK